MPYIETTIPKFAWSDVSRANGVKFWSFEASPASWSVRSWRSLLTQISSVRFPIVTGLSRASSGGFQNRLQVNGLFYPGAFCHWNMDVFEVLTPIHSQWRGYKFVCEQDHSFCRHYHQQFVTSAKAWLNSLAQDFDLQVFACSPVSVSAFYR